MKLKKKVMTQCTLQAQCSPSSSKQHCKLSVAPHALGPQFRCSMQICILYVALQAQISSAKLNVTPLAQIRSGSSIRCFKLKVTLQVHSSSVSSIKLIVDPNTQVNS